MLKLSIAGGTLILMVNIACSAESPPGGAGGAPAHGGSAAGGSASGAGTLGGAGTAAGAPTVAGSAVGGNASAGAGVAGTSQTGGGGGGGGGASNDAALDAACTPQFTLSMEASEQQGQVFMDAVAGDPEGFVQNIGRGVCRILYRKPEEVRAANHVTLHIEDTDGVAWKAGDVGEIDVGISTQHLQNVEDDGRDVAAEISGILYHEMTHMYQNDDKPEATFEYIANMYEGIGDAVRIRAGFTPANAQPSKSGNWYEKTYTGQAFFWLYIDNAHPNFVYQLNLSMKKDGKPWQPTEIQTITGKSADSLWTEYQAASCCSGNTRDCCK